MKKLVVILAILAFAPSAQADTISLVGDKDCFGLGGSCPDGTLWRDDLGGIFFTSYQTAGDPLYTDEWAGFGAVSFTHNYVLGATPMSALLELRIAGIHDINELTVYSVLFNGVSIGVIPPNANTNNFQEVLTYQFVVPTGLLTGIDVVSWNGTGGDGYAIDYSQLSVTNSASVPDTGSTLLLFGIGLAGLRAWRKR